MVLGRFPRIVPGWKSPIIIGRHAFGDQYQAQDLVLDKPSDVELVIKPKDGSDPIVLPVCSLKDTTGVTMAMFNTTKVTKGY